MKRESQVDAIPLVEEVADRIELEWDHEDHDHCHEAWRRVGTERRVRQERVQEDHVDDRCDDPDDRDRGDPGYPPSDR